MTTVVEARKADGSLLGRCDAKCHTAKGPKCKCVCKGRNHGVGFDQAFRNLHDLDHDASGDIIYVTRQFQAGLFTQEKEQEPL